LKTTIVLVCQGDTVLDLGILSVLQKAEKWMQIHTVPDRISKLLKSVEITQPDVVIISQGSQVACHSRSKDLLEFIPPFRLITVCAESNYVSVNQNQIVQIEEATDIIHLIQNNAFRKDDLPEKG
jgi:hypothetical protein